MLPATIAVFDDTISLSRDPMPLHKYAVIKVIPYAGYYIFQEMVAPQEVPMTGGWETGLLGSFTVCMYPQQPTERRVSIWTTGWKLIVSGEDIPVIDIGFRDLIRGCNFSSKKLDDTIPECRARQSAQRLLRMDAFRLPVAPAPAAAPSPPLQIPSFVAKLVKEEHIRKETACPISSSHFKEDHPAAITPCFHLFEPESLQKWLDMKKECPICRAPVTSTMII